LEDIVGNLTTSLFSYLTFAIGTNVFFNYQLILIDSLGWLR